MFFITNMIMIQEKIYELHSPGPEICILINRLLEK
jgi:hypothetical protein